MNNFTKKKKKKKAKLNSVMSTIREKYINEKK